MCSVSWRDAVGHGVEPLAGEVDLRAVGEVAAVRQAHREDGVARLHEGAVGGDVGAGAAVRLQVGVVGAEQRLGALDADVLGLVDVRAAAVVALARVALGVLVRQRRPERGEDGRRGEVLAGDQLQAAAQAVELGRAGCWAISGSSPRARRSQVPRTACRGHGCQPRPGAHCSPGPAWAASPLRGASPSSASTVRARRVRSGVDVDGADPDHPGHGAR